MKIFTPVFFAFFALVPIRSSFFAQCNPNQCLMPVVAFSAPEACILPNPGALDCYVGATVNSTPMSFPPTWCSTIENNQWFAFTADAPTATFEITTLSCSSGNSIQAAVLSTSDCVNFQFVSPCIGGIPVGSSEILTATGLTPGQVYYLMFDGSGGALCDFSINGGSTIDGPEQFCIPSSGIATFTSTVNSTWSIEPAGMGNFIGGNTGTSATIGWVQTGTAEVCALNVNCPNATPACETVIIGQDAETSEDVLLCQDKSVECGGQTFTSPGSFPVHLTTWQGCDSVVTCNVELIPTVIMPMEVVDLCYPATYNVCGNVLDQSGFHAVTCTNWQGCDSIVNVDLAILDPLALIGQPAELNCEPGSFIILEGSGSLFGFNPTFEWAGPGIDGPNDQIVVVVNEPGEYCLTVTQERNGFSCSNTGCVEVVLNSQTPEQPSLDGPGSVCAGEIANYTVTPEAGPPPTGYTWTVPAGATFTNVNATTIAVTWGSTSGNVCVTANNSCGASVPRCKNVTVKPAPTATLSGSPSICPGSGSNANLTITLTGTAPWQVGYTLNGTPQPTLNIAASPYTLTTSQTGAYALTSVVSGGCNGTVGGSATVSNFTPPTATLSGGGTICQSSSQTAPLTFTATGTAPFTVTYSINGGAPTSLTFTTNPTTLQVTGAGNYVLLTVTNANGCTGTVSGTALVNAVGAPVVSGLMIDCDATETNYTVTFTITGGDPGSYSVTGNCTETNPNPPPFICVCGPNPSGSAYTYVINDANNCSPTTLSGTFLCNCATNAGTMVGPAITLCQTQTATATHNLDEYLDGNDLLRFVLHDGSGNSLGTVFGMNNIPQFSFAPPMQTGVTYYISSVAGSNDGSSEIDLADPCLSVSIGTPVVWNDLASASIGSDAGMCPGETVSLGFQITGTPPFNLTYSDGSQNFPLTGIFDGHSLTVSPSQTTTYNLVSVSGGLGCPGTVSGTATVTVWNTATSSQTAEICEGESILLGGAQQFAAGVYFDTLTTFHGCDSIIATTLTLNSPDTTLIADSSCEPSQTGVFTQNLTNQNDCDSLVITTVSFSQSETTHLSASTCDPNQTGVSVQNLTTSDGCDSIVITTTTLLPSDTTHLVDASCNPGSVGTFTQNLTNQNGCDSMVILTVVYAPTDSTFLTDASCDPNETGVFVQNLVTPDGCDSVVVTTVEWLPSSFSPFQSTTCDPSQAGVFTFLFTNWLGCDSTVIRTVTLLPSDTTKLFDSSCNPNSVGTFTQVLTNSSGCDSTVILTVTYSQTDSVFLSTTTCDPGGVGTFTQSFVTPEGCDSIVITSVSLIPSDQVDIASTTCDPGAAGVFTYNLSNQHGCDSTVTETVTLLPSDTTFLTDVTCDPAQAGTTLTVLTNQNGCDSTVILQTNLLPPNGCNLYATLVGSIIPCGEMFGSLTLTVLLGEAPFSYEVFLGNEPAASGNIANLDEPVVLTGLFPGTYTVTVVNGSFTSTASATIELQLPPTPSAVVSSDFNGSSVSCNGSSNGSALAGATGGEPPYFFDWSSGGTTAEITGLAAGTYTVTVTGANGCTATDVVTLTEPDSLKVAFIVNDINCFGQDEGVVYVETSGGTPLFSYSIDGVNFQQNAVFTGLDAGVFELTVLDANNCKASEILAVDAPIPVTVDLGQDIFIELLDSAKLNALINVPFDSLSNVLWTGLDSANCPQCLEQALYPLITSSYSINVVGDNGCKDEDDILVFVDRQKSVYVPNAFSPNEDGYNDVVGIFAKEGLVKNIKSFLLFNRWGETVWQFHNFQPNDPSLGWDGVHRGKPLNPAVFAWFAEVEFVDGEVKIFKGDVTLMR